MPEKPEVITVANALKKRLIGKTIRSCHVFWDNIIAFPSVSLFCEKIVSQTIYNITTRGKFLVFELDDYSLIIHLRMEGKFFFRQKGEEFLKHEHVEFVLDDDTSFRYHDVRKFGKMYLILKQDTYLVPPLSKLGYEYDDISLTKNILYEKIHQRHIPIKTLLLDQSIITGIGNIYADEILFLSHLSPKRLGSKVLLRECDEIITYTRDVLNHAISLGGTTIRTFTSSEGVHGLFQNELYVHTKSECPICHRKIVKEQLGGRGTYYCQSCQK